MVGLTGILGSAACQPGSFQLGAGPVADSGIVITETVNVSQTISFSIEHHLYWVLPDDITLAQSVIANVERIQTITSTVTVSTDILGGPSTESRLTGQFVEVLYVGIPNVYYTAQIVEVLYKKSTALTVTSTITVSQTVTGRNNIIRQTISHSIGVVPATNIIGSGVISNQTITSNITVTPQIIQSGDRNVRVTQSVSISPTIQYRNTVVRITLTQAITATEGETPAVLPAIHEIVDNVNVGETIRSSPVVQTIAQSIVVTPTITGGSSDRDITVTQNITVGQSIAVGTNYETVLSNIGLTQSITPRSDKYRITLGDNIYLSTALYGGNSNRIITVTTIGWVSSYVNRVDRLPDIFSDTIQVFQTVRREDQTVEITVAQPIELTQRFSQFPEQTVSDSITVSPHIAGDVNDGITDYIYVAQEIITRNTNTRIKVQHNLVLNHSYIVHGAKQNVYKTVESVLTLKDQVRAGGAKIIVTDSITVDDTINAVLHAMRFTVRDTIAVSQWVHPNLNRQTISHSIGVTQRIKQLDWTIRQQISVRARPHIIKITPIVDNAPITDSLDARRVRTINFTDNMPITDIFQRQFSSARKFVDYIPVGRDFYPIEDPLFGIYIVPALVTTFMGKTPSVYLFTPNAGQVILPPPEFGDADGNASTASIARTMTGGTYAYIKSSQRQTFKWAFVVGQLKALELRVWLIKALSETVEVTDWNGIKWIGKIMTNPFTLTFQGRWEGEVEKVLIDLEFQVVRA